MDTNKFLILENDIESQGLPNIIEDVIEAMPLAKFDTWWWFSQDVTQNFETSIDKFAKANRDTFFLSNPSFVGYNNSLAGNIYLFDCLMDRQIKICICLIYFPDFYFYLIKFVNEAYHSNEKKDMQNINRLKKCLAFHEIYYTNLDRLYDADYDVTKSMVRITWEMLEKFLYKPKADVWVSPPNKKRFKSKVRWVHIREDDFNKSTISIDRGNGGYSSVRDDFPIDQIEKIVAAKAKK